MSVFKHCSETPIGHRHWTREPMVWMVIAIPFSAVVVGVILMVLSIKSWDGLVVDDYYKHGKEINRVLARDQVAIERGISATIELDTRERATTNSVETINAAMVVRVSYAETAASFDAVLNVRWVHRTRSGLDRETVVTHVGDGVYRGSAEPIPAGRWHLHLDAPDWRLTQSLTLPVKQPIALLPNAP